MRNLLFILATSLAISCSTTEPVVPVDFDIAKFNKELSQYEIRNGDEVVQMLFGNSDDSQKKIEIKSRSKEVVDIVFIKQNVPNKYIKDEKYLIECKKDGLKWQVISVKKNWKYRNNKANWDTLPCRQ